MTDKKKNILFVVCAYTFFWFLLAFIIVGVLRFGNAIILPIGQIIGSWTPTIALLVLFKKLYPESTIKAFYKNAFKARLNWKLILLITVIQIFIALGAAGIVAITTTVSLRNLFDLSLQTIAMGFVMSLLTGATGEESGWRGFLQPSIEKKANVIKTSLIIGIIWGFWHTPLWFVNGYSGTDLIQYIVSFLIFVISLAIIIGICYRRCRNLFIPMWLHFMFNFTLSVISADAALGVITWSALLYAITAAGYIVWHRKSNRVCMSQV